jgi:hypothetical protein
MRRDMVGGYQGPVVVLTPDGQEVARAACRYRAEPDGRGGDYWHGRLHRVTPPGAVTSGAYFLQFPLGEQGAVVIEEEQGPRDTRFFVGTGDRPINPL